MGEFICGECLETMQQMPSDYIDFVFTSPPYADQIKDYGNTDKKIKPDQFVNWFLPRAKEIYRILKPTGSFVLNINDKLDGRYHWHCKYCCSSLLNHWLHCVACHGQLFVRTKTVKPLLQSLRWKGLWNKYR